MAILDGKMRQPKGWNNPAGIDTSAFYKYTRPADVFLHVFNWAAMARIRFPTRKHSYGNRRKTRDVKQLMYDDRILQKHYRRRLRKVITAVHDRLELWIPFAVRHPEIGKILRAIDKRKMDIKHGNLVEPLVPAKPSLPEPASEPIQAPPPVEKTIPDIDIWEI